MTVHRNLTGADLHEPKGVETASAGMVYVSNGSGSGSWVAASSVITNSAFSTGDLKPTHKNTPDVGWIFWNEGTIGDGSSGASIRANADTQALFTLYWNAYSNTFAPVSGGRGASAAADYATHKTIGIPAGAGRALGVAGSATGLTSRPYGTLVGSETVALSTTNLPAYTPTGTVNTTVTTTVNDVRLAGGGSVLPTSTCPGTSANGSFGSTTTSVTSTAVSTFFGAAQGGTSAPFGLMQPTAFVNIMIKL